MFPRIETIDDVLPHIKDKEEFIIGEREGYTFIDYLYSDTDTFDNEYALECRGIKFDRDGRILARPFQKFFNLGEKEQHEEIDWKQPYMLLDKLDGSMIHPALIDGEIHLMTRKGITEVSEQAKKECMNGQLHQFCYDALTMGMTPIFEYVSPKNRIILKYDKPEMILLAIRDTKHGDYLAHTNLQTAGDLAKVPVVDKVLCDDIRTIKEFVDNMEDKEGCVVVFNNGHRIKVKNADYVLKHRVKSYLDNERSLVELILNGQEDDILPLLTIEEQEDINTFKDDLWTSITIAKNGIQDLIFATKKMDQKEFALYIQSRYKNMTSILFTCRKNEEILENVLNYIKKNLTKQDKYDNVKSVLSLPTWEY